MAIARLGTAFGMAIAALTGCAHGPARQPVTAPPAALSAVIEPLLAQTRVPSVAVARVERGHIAWAGTWGQRRAGIPATLDTLYNIASLAKPISAETVLRAASRGLLQLDEPMAPFWMDPDVAADPRHRILTPRHSLTHRTGLPNWREGRLAFVSDPGTAVLYSGEGYEYLARFTERRAGSAFEALAQELVFGPAGMAETAYTRRPWFADRIAVPTDAEGLALEPMIRSAFVASDDVYTTVTDYARFLVSTAARQGLSPEIAGQRERVQASTRERACPPERAASCPDGVGFGLGWDLVVFGDRATLWHTGADAGAFALAYVTPETGDGMVVLTNSSRGYLMILPILEAAGAESRFLAYLRASAN